MAVCFVHEDVSKCREYRGASVAVEFKCCKNVVCGSATRIGVSKSNLAIYRVSTSFRHPEMVGKTFVVGANGECLDPADGSLVASHS